MTQEEKAKAYDYAVAYAKSELDCMDEDYRCVNITKDDVISMYAKLFPELREDKDVKLNRKLIYGLRSLMRLGNNTFAGADIEDCIDYLERLKAEESVLSEINVEYGDNVDFSNEAISFIYGGDGCSPTKSREDVAEWLTSVPDTIKHLAYAVERLKKRIPSEDCIEINEDMRLGLSQALGIVREISQSGDGVYESGLAIKTLEKILRGNNGNKLV